MEERAQLVLVGALVLATVFVGLALVVNTVIFTENLATRQDADSQGGPLQYRDAATGATADFVGQVNRDHHDSRSALASNLSAAVENWSRLGTVDRVTSGAVTDVAVLDTANGTRLGQTNASRNFTAGGANATDGNWTLADAERTRRFRLNVSQSDLYQSSADGTISDSELDNVTDEAFHVVVDDGTATQVYLFADNGGAVRVFVENASGYYGANDADCQTDESHVTVDLVAGTVEGRDCAPLGFYDPGTAHTIAYRNATLGGSDRATGTYELLVEPSSVPDNYYAGSEDSPFTTPAIYAATVRVEYQSDDLHYRSTVEVVP